jgi:hypothetical protein
MYNICMMCISELAVSDLVMPTRQVNLLSILGCPDTGLDKFLEALVVDV